MFRQKNLKLANVEEEWIDKVDVKQDVALNLSQNHFNVGKGKIKLKNAISKSHNNHFTPFL